MSSPASLSVALDALVGLVGRDLGPGPWVTVDQAMIDRFAEATGDEQWIHVDPDRAAEGPYGSTIAHGYLTLSLIPRLCRGMLQVEGARLAVNYGVNRSRFPGPVHVDSRIRAQARLSEVEERDGGDVQIVRSVQVEVQGQDKPGCVAEVVTLYRR